MFSIVQKLTFGAAAAFMAFAVLATQSYADTNISVSGNGADSENAVDYGTETETTVEQTNNTTIENDVENTATSGDNQATNNTGGSTTIETGDSTANTSVTVTGSSNTAEVDACGCDEDTTIDVNENGARSFNFVQFRRTSRFAAVQDNTQSYLNTLRNRARSGGNIADSNTGGTEEDDTTSINTGNSSSTTTVSVEGTSNSIVDPDTDNGDDNGDDEEEEENVTTLTAESDSSGTNSP